MPLKLIPSPRNVLALAMAFTLPLSSWGSLKCDSPELFAVTETEAVLQLIKAEGETVVPKGVLFPQRSMTAALQIRRLESSSLRDYQVHQVHAYGASDFKQFLLDKPQLVQVSGAGFLRPVLLALPETVSLAQRGTTALERRIDTGDPSRAGRDIVMTSLRAEPSGLAYEEKILRRRASGATSTSRRMIEMRGELRGQVFAVSRLAITIDEPNVGEQPTTQVIVALPQPLWLKAH